MRGAKPRLDCILVALPVSCIMSCMRIEASESGDNISFYCCVGADHIGTKRVSHSTKRLNGNAYILVVMGHG